MTKKEKKQEIKRLDKLVDDWIRTIAIIRTTMAEAIASLPTDIDIKQTEQKGF